MGTTYRFLAMEDEACLIPDWFRSRSPAPIEHSEQGRYSFYFREFGPLAHDVKKSPFVSVFMPGRKRQVLLTCGEIHFLTTPLSLYPQLAEVNRAFRGWLSQYTCVFSRRKAFKSEWSYYLEGQIQNYDPDVFALPNALESLRGGQYFVADDDNDWILDRVCRELVKRGVPGVV